ncbi:hypothetical protein BJ742DRAFT_900534 [Cladochytrium replicatum]|nr:hypothetical protein BJ742DRAFT_900534 [Cladochytrium replicatum]
MQRLFRIRISCNLRSHAPDSCRKRNGKRFDLEFRVMHANPQLQLSRTANLVMKCKFCKVQSTANIELPTLKPYTAEDSEKFTPWMVIEARGIEPWNMQFRSVHSGSGEWAEYDESAGNLNIETKITKA